MGRVAAAAAPKYEDPMRRGALLALSLLALAAGCSKPDPGQVRILRELRVICAGLTATPTTYEEAARQFASGPAPVGITGNCSTTTLYPQGSSCPASDVKCRVVYFWQPGDPDLCSPGPGLCLYTCEAFAPGAQAGLPVGTETICAAVSSGP